LMGEDRGGGVTSIALLVISHHTTPHSHPAAIEEKEFYLQPAPSETHNTTAAKAAPTSTT
jgi:hypothetical protein